MKARYVFIRQGDVLVPVYDDGKQAVRHLKEGERFLVHLDRVRYPEHHRLTRLVFSKLADATGYTEDAIVIWLKKATGLVDLVRLPDGTIHKQPRSTAWESMGQDEYQAWWEDALMVIKEQILPKIPKREYEEIRRIITGEGYVKADTSSHSTPHQDSSS